MALARVTDCGSGLGVHSPSLWGPWLEVHTTSGSPKAHYGTVYLLGPLRESLLFWNAPIDPGAHLEAARVERYAGTLDALPLLVVFDTPEGLLVADGYHRLAAARHRGLQTVEAEVRAGSRHDALRYAAKVGAVQRGISPEAAVSYIERYAERYAKDRRTSER